MGPRTRAGANRLAGDWVHAYLHRKAGDEDNAAYWYRRAGQPICSAPLDAEWQAIASALIAGGAR